MPAAHDYAECIRERRPRKLQDAREAAGLSMDALPRSYGHTEGLMFPKGIGREFEGNLPSMEFDRCQSLRGYVQQCAPSVESLLC